MYKIKTILLATIILLIGCAMLFMSACQSSLTVTYEEGDYGTASGKMVQTVSKSSKLAEPAITADQGYIFVGFKPHINDLPKSGEVVAIAQYIRVELFLVDRATDEPIEEDCRLEIPCYNKSEEMQSGSTILPNIKIRVTNVQENTTEEYTLDRSSLRANSEEGFFFPDSVNSEEMEKANINSYPSYMPYLYLRGLSHRLADSVVLKDIAAYFAENDYIKISNIYINSKDYNQFDWETRLTLNLKNGSQIISTVDFDVYRDHLRMTEMEIWRSGLIESDGTLHVHLPGQPVYPAASGDKILFDGSARYEDNSTGLLWNIEYIITRIWSIHGDEIVPEDFDLYAVFVPDENNPDSTRLYRLQLTDMIANGWRVEMYAYYTKDNVTSNTLIVEVY